MENHEQSIYIYLVVLEVYAYDLVPIVSVCLSLSVL